MKSYAGKLFDAIGRDEAYAFDVPLFKRETSEQKDDRLALQAVRNGCGALKAIARYIGRPADGPGGLKATADALERLRAAGKVKRGPMGWVLA